MPDRTIELQLSPEALEVLTASGISKVEALAEADVADLQNAFIAAAKEGRYPEKFPSLVKIAAWVEQARMMAGQQELGAGMGTDLDSIPTAIVKPVVKKKKAYAGSGPHACIRKVELRPDRHRARKRKSNNSAASRERVDPTPRGENPLGAVVEELNPDTERTIHHRRQAPVLRKPVTSADPAVPSSVEEKRAESGGEEGSHSGGQGESPRGERSVRAEESEERESSPVPFHSFEDYKRGRLRVKPLDCHSVKLGEDAAKSTGTEQESFEEEQASREWMPIWRVRGVRHPDGRKVYLGALITFMAVFLTTLTAIGAAIFPLYLEDYRREFAGLALLALIFGITYSLMAVGVRCRVCSCQLFYSRRCLKNANAHRFLGGFPMLAQMMHILLWRWFRCMYCGTAVRLRGGRGGR